MTTTLKDYGRRSEKFGNVPWHNAYKYRFYFIDQCESAYEVHNWLYDNCIGLYRVDTYTHRRSLRDRLTGKVTQRVAFADKVFVDSDIDAVTLRLTFNVSEVTVRRSERLDRWKREDLNAQHEREQAAAD